MELLRIPSEHSITEFDQRGSMIDACVPGASPSRQSLKIIFLPGLQTALTEQLGVVSGSVGTLVDCRNTSRKELDLLAGDRAKPAGQVIIGMPRPKKLLASSGTRVSARRMLEPEPDMKSASLGPASSHTMVGTHASVTRASAGRYREGSPSSGSGKG